MCQHQYDEQERRTMWLKIFGAETFTHAKYFRISGMPFFHSLPFPKIWAWIFFFPSRSRIVFFHSLPVPEVWEWNYPFPFMNSRNSLPLTPDSWVSWEKSNLEWYSNWYHFYFGSVICITFASHSDVNHVLTAVGISMKCNIPTAQKLVWRNTIGCK